MMIVIDWWMILIYFFSMWRFMIQVIFMDFDKIETYSGLVHQLSLQPLGQAFTGHFPEILA